jgi:hypothetical protein
MNGHRQPRPPHMIDRTADREITRRASNGDPDPKITSTWQEDIDSVNRKLAELHRDKFFGRFEVEFREGEMNLIEIRQTIKPKNL